MTGSNQSTATPNQALRRTAFAVTAPAADHRHLCFAALTPAGQPAAGDVASLHSAHRQVPHPLRLSLSLGSLDVAPGVMLRTLLIFLFAVSAFGSELAKESAEKLLESRIKKEGEVVFIPWNGKLPKDGSNCYLRFKQKSEVGLAFMGYGGDLLAGSFSFITDVLIEPKLRADFRGSRFIYWPIMVLRRDGEDLLLYRDDGKKWWHDLYPPAGKLSERDTWPFQPEYIDNFWPLRAAKKNRAEQGGNPK